MQWYIVWWKKDEGYGQAMTRAKTEQEAREKVEKFCSIKAGGVRHETGFALKMSKANKHHYIQVP